MQELREGAMIDISKLEYEMRPINRSLNHHDASTSGSEKTASLGEFELLSTEILTMVIEGMDIRTLAAFRAVNRSARHLIDSLTRFKSIHDQAPEILSAVAALLDPLPRLRRLSIPKLEQILQDKYCPECAGAERGELLSMEMCAVYCLSCFYDLTNYDQDYY